MGFSAYLRAFLKAGTPLLESEEPVVERGIVLDYDTIKNQIETKVGGELSDQNSFSTSIEGLEQVFDAIPLEYLENPNNEHLEEIFGLLSQKNRIDFLEKFTERESNAANDIVKSIESIDRDRDEIKFIQYVKSYTSVSERLLKIYRLCSSQTGEQVSEAVQLEPEVKTKIDKIISMSKEGATTGFSKILDAEKKNIEALPETPEGESILIKYKDLIEFLGLSQFLKSAMDSKEEKIREKNPEDTKSLGIKRKKRILDRLIRSITLSRLPAMSNEIIESPGDHFQLFKALEKQNKAWMDLSLSKYVFNNDAARMKEFESGPAQTESPKEEDQLAYLRAAGSWIRTYIDVKDDGDLSDKDSQNLKTSLGNVVVQKEKEIKNYYLSREFNLGNFAGIQLKPELKLPLYTTIKLAVSKEDRKKESPLRNILKGMGQIVTGLFAAIPDKSNPAIAKAARDRNRAVFNGISSIIKGTVIAVGGKQAGRDYSTGVEKLTGNKEKGGLKEDMLSVADSPGHMVVNPEAPGQIMQTPASIASDMDTFSLLGPGKKSASKKKKKAAKKKENLTRTVPNFADFMQRK